MIIHNTSTVPDETINIIALFSAKPLDMSRTFLHVKKTTKNNWSGDANVSDPESIKPKNIDYLVLIRIGSFLVSNLNNKEFPISSTYYKRPRLSPEITMNNLEELLICLISHELFHVFIDKQLKNEYTSLNTSQTIALTRVEEIACEGYALSRLQVWREINK